MKNVLTTLGIMVFLYACGGDTENTMTVTGKIKGLKKGTLYLQHLPDTVLITLDSLEIEGDGNFNFKTELESPELFYLYLSKKDNNEVNDRITFFGEPGTITINTSWNTFDTNVKILGSETQQKFEEYKKVMSTINTRSLEIVQQGMNPNQPLTNEQLDSLDLLNTKNVKRGYIYAINFALNNRDSYIAPYIALKEIPDANVKYLDSIAMVMTPKVSESKYGKKLKKYLKDKNKL